MRCKKPFSLLLAWKLSWRRFRYKLLATFRSSVRQGFCLYVPAFLPQPVLWGLWCFASFLRCVCSYHYFSPWLNWQYVPDTSCTCCRSVFTPEIRPCTVYGGGGGVQFLGHFPSVLAIWWWCLRLLPTLAFVCVDATSFTFLVPASLLLMHS